VRGVEATDEEAQNWVKNKKASLMALHCGHLNVCMLKKNENTA